MRRVIPIWRRPAALRLAAARKTLLPDRHGPLLSYVDTGPSAATGTVILVHGFAGSAVTWSPQIRVLSRRWRLLAPDLRGHGRSETPMGPYDMGTLCQDLQSLLDAVDPPRPRLLVGHSWGGCIAAAFAASAVGAARVDRLALLNTPARFLIPWSGQLALNLPDWWYRLWWRRRPRWDATPRALKAMARQGLAVWDARDVFPRVRLPCLVLHGADDQDFPAWAFAPELQPPEARCIDLPRAQHKAQIQSAHAVNSALDAFLSASLPAVDAAGEDPPDPVSAGAAAALSSLGAAWPR